MSQLSEARQSLTDSGEVGCKKQPCSASRRISNIEDILIEIFLILARDTRRTYIKSISGVWDWSCVAEVCRYWRQVAIAAPNLWSYLHDFRSTDRTRRFLLLSKDYDLTVYYSDQAVLYGKPAIRILKMILKEFQRIRYLWIEIFPSNDDENIRSLLEQPAPRMESITLKWAGNSPDIIFRFPSAAPRVLQRVALYSVNLSSNSSRFAGLSSLSIQYCNMSLSALLEILDACPELIALTLTSCDLHRSQPLKSVNLPYLLDMNLHFHQFSPCVAFVQNLEVPNLIKWKIACGEYLDRNDVAELEVFSRLLRREYGFKRMKITSLHSSRTSSAHIKVFRDPSSLVPGEAEFRVSSRLALDELFPHLIELFRSLLGSTEILDIDILDPENTVFKSVNIEPWYQILRASTSVRVVHAVFRCDGCMPEANSGTDFLKAVACLHLPNPSVTEVPCPKLDCISIYNEAAAEQFLFTLEEALRARSGHGLGIRKVSIRSNSAKQRSDALLQWAEEVEWAK